MNIGTLDFEILGKTDGIKNALEEAKTSIKNFTDEAKSGGAGMGDAMQAAAAKIEQAWGQLESVGETNRQALKGLEAEYAQVGKDAAAAFNKATAAGDEEYRTLTARQNVLGKEIQQRKEVLNQVEQLTDELNKEEQAFNKLATETQKNESRTASFRQQLKQLTQEMAMQEAEARKMGGETAVYALRATDAFKQMQIQAAQLTDAMSDAQKQAQILSNDNAGLQGVISAVGGVAGAFSVAQGTMGLFAGESEDLQKIMVKVQSIMAITMGLQQVANTLNKDSAASLTMFNKVREAFVVEMQRGYAELEKDTVEKGKNAAATGAEAAAGQAAANSSRNAAAAKKAESAANSQDTKNKVANTVATGGQAVATKALQRANIMLSASFKAVGAAIKSIPVIGWILAGVSALAGVISLLTKRAREAKKEQEEYYKAVSEGAAEPVAKIESLAAKWGSLGNDMKAKQKFVEENKAKFEELGISIKSVEDAENALVKNKQAFIQAQIAKAKALAATNKAAELQKEVLELQLEKEDYQSRGRKRKANRRQKEIDELEGQIKDLYNRALDAEAAGDKALQEAGISAAKTYAAGTVGYYEQAIQVKQAALKDLSDPKAYEKAKKEIEAMQKTLDGITGANRRRTSGGTVKDPFKEKLDKQKAQYQQYAKWRNSTDEILQQAAATQFQQLLQQGGTYLEYLKKQREKLMSEMVGKGTKKQRDQLATINNAIAEETKETVLQQFDQEIQRQLSGANSLLEKLAIIERKRKELANDGTELDNEQRQMLDKQREQITQEMENQYRAAQQEYYDYLESRLTAFEQYQQKMAELQEKLDKESDPLQRAMIVKQMGILQQQQYTRDAQAADELVKQYRTAEEKMTDIKAEYEEKRRVLINRGGELEVEMREAIAAGDDARIEQIKKEQEAIERALKGIEKDLSKSLTEFLGEEIVGKMLDDAGTLTVEKIDEIIAAVEKKKAELPVDVDPKKFEELLEKLKKLKKETREQQATIKSIISELQKGDIGEALKQTMVIAEKYGSTVVETYSEVVNLLKQMGAAGDEISQQILSDIGEVAGSAAQLAVDIATQNWGNAVVSGVKLIAGAVKLWNDANRENADAIKESEDKINELENSIKNLRNTLKRTYDSGRYDLQKEIIDKLREEIAEEKKKLEAIRKDIDGSSSDYTEDDYNAQLQHIEDLEEQLNQALDDLAEDITQITIPEIGQQISDALVNAFANGLRGADLDKEINKVVNQILKNAALNLIKADYLMPQIEEWYKEFQAAMEDGLTEDEADALRASMLEKTQEFKDAMQAWQEMWGDDELDSNTLSGAIKGASQESIDLLAGYTNATRIIEQSQLDVLRSQLARIASIDARAAQAVELLNSIYRNMGMTTTITAPQVNVEDAENRAYGITNDYEL